MTDIESRLREALEEHGWDLAEWDLHKPLNRCICGEMVGNKPGDFTAHQAAVLAGIVQEAMAGAWDEGHERGFWNGRLSQLTVPYDAEKPMIGIEDAKANNPYRKAEQ